MEPRPPRQRSDAADRRVRRPSAPLRQHARANPGGGLDLWNATLDRCLETDNKPIKAFLTHEADVCGIGNGDLQDLLFRARLSPKRKVKTLSPDDRQALHHALRETLEEAIALGGRDTERTLFGQPGGYVPLLDRQTKDSACIRCGTPIRKIQYHGGSCDLCPTCRV